MSSSHDNHHNQNEEPKTVSFRTPMILGLVTLLAIVLLVSTCDNKKCCHDGQKCEEAAEQNSHGGHHDASHTENTEKPQGTTILNSAEENPVTDSLQMHNSADTSATMHEHSPHH